MVLPDVNVLVAAFLEDHEFHTICRGWLERTLRSPQAFGCSELVSGAFIRIVTNPSAIRSPVSVADAFQFTNAIMRPAHALRISPGPRHWEIFSRLCLETHIRGTAVADAYYAALAIEHGCEWVTLDSDFARFSDLRWRRPA